MEYNTIIVLCGVAGFGALAGLIGSLAVLRGRALVGDAVSHAALPGLCLAYLITEIKQLPVLLAGALASGLLGVACIAALRRWTKIKEDAAIGTVLSVFFGLGLVLMRLIQTTVESGSKAGLSSFIYGKTAGLTRADLLLIGLVSLVCLVVIGLLTKELKTVLFDAEFAGAQGWPVFFLDLLLMTLLALTVVIGLPTVGVVLTSAMLITPGVTARFWIDRISSLLWLSAGLGLATGAAGALISARTALPAGPVIVLVGASLLAVSFVLSPGRGMAAHLRLQSRWKVQLWMYRLLSHLDKSERQGDPRHAEMTVPEIAQAWRISQTHVRTLANKACAAGTLLLDASSGRLSLTDAGRAELQRQRDEPTAVTA